MIQYTILFIKNKAKTAPFREAVKDFVIRLWQPS